MHGKGEGKNKMLLAVSEYVRYASKGCKVLVTLRVTPVG